MGCTRGFFVLVLFSLSLNCIHSITVDVNPSLGNDNNCPTTRICKTLEGALSLVGDGLISEVRLPAGNFTLPSGTYNLTNITLTGDSPIISCEKRCLLTSFQNTTVKNIMFHGTPSTSLIIYFIGGHHTFTKVAFNSLQIREDLIKNITDAAVTAGVLNGTFNIWDLSTDEYFAIVNILGDDNLFDEVSFIQNDVLVPLRTNRTYDFSVVNGQNVTFRNSVINHNFGAWVFHGTLKMINCIVENNVNLFNIDDVTNEYYILSRFASNIRRAVFLLITQHIYSDPFFSLYDSTFTNNTLKIFTIPSRTADPMEILVEGVALTENEVTFSGGLFTVYLAQRKDNTSQFYSDHPTSEIINSAFTNNGIRAIWKDCTVQQSGTQTPSFGATTFGLAGGVFSLTTNYTTLTRKAPEDRIGVWNITVTETNFTNNFMISEMLNTIWNGIEFVLKGGVFATTFPRRPADAAGYSMYFTDVTFENNSAISVVANSSDVPNSFVKGGILFSDILRNMTMKRVKFINNLVLNAQNNLYPVTNATLTHNNSLQLYGGLINTLTTDGSPSSSSPTFITYDTVTFSKNKVYLLQHLVDPMNAKPNLLLELSGGLIFGNDLNLINTTITDNEVILFSDLIDSGLADLTAQINGGLLAHRPFSSIASGNSQEAPRFKNVLVENNFIKSLGEISGGIILYMPGLEIVDRTDPTFDNFVVQDNVIIANKAMYGAVTNYTFLALPDSDSKYIIPFTKPFDVEDNYIYSDGPIYGLVSTNILNPGKYSIKSNIRINGSTFENNQVYADSFSGFIVMDGYHGATSSISSVNVTGNYVETHQAPPLMVGTQTPTGTVSLSNFTFEGNNIVQISDDNITHTWNWTSITNNNTITNLVTDGDWVCCSRTQFTLPCPEVLDNDTCPSPTDYNLNDESQFWTTPLVIDPLIDIINYVGLTITFILGGVNPPIDNCMLHTMASNCINGKEVINAPFETMVIDLNLDIVSNGQVFFNSKNDTNTSTVVVGFPTDRLNHDDSAISAECAHFAGTLVIKLNETITNQTTLNLVTANPDCITGTFSSIVVEDLNNETGVCKSKLKTSANYNAGLTLTLNRQSSDCDNAVESEGTDSTLIAIIIPSVVGGTIVIVAVVIAAIAVFLGIRKKNNPKTKYSSAVNI